MPPTGAETSYCIQGGNSRTCTLGDILGGPLAASPTPAVINNTTLQGVVTTNAVNGQTAIRRLGFATAGDGGDTAYVYSSSACTTADNGAQVVANGTGCWKAIFGSWANVKVWGAKGDNSTDDTAAVQAAATAAGALNIPLFFPVGTYCMKTGPVAVSSTGANWLGVDRQLSIISACGSDVQVLTTSGFHNQFVNLQFYGSDTPGTTKDTVTINPSGFGGYSETTFQSTEGYRGRYVINSSSGEIYLYNNKFQTSYGQAVIYLTNGGGYIWRNKMDGSWPGGTPNIGSVSTPIPAWQSAHAYTACVQTNGVCNNGSTSSLVTVGNYVLQATQSGTSGGTVPTVLKYGATITDGTVHWQLAKPATSYGIQCDTACGGMLYVDLNDWSAAYDDGMIISNTLAGNNPYGIYVSRNSCGSLLANCILVQAGSALHFTDNHSGSAVGNPFSCYSFVNGYDISITGGECLNASNGVFVSTSGGVNINNFQAGPVTTGLSIAANTSNVTVTNGRLGGSELWGTNANGVFVAAGTGDYLDFGHINMHGATNPYQINATGTHITVIDDDGGQYKMSQHLAVLGTVPTIGSGFNAGATIQGSDQAGRVRMGGSGTATSGTINFGSNWTTLFPACIANNESSIARPVAATLTGFGTLLISAAATTPMQPNDAITWVCFGLK